MFTFGPILFQIALRTAIIYVVLLVGIRLSGKREIGQMTPFDLVVLLTISNAVQNAMTGPDTSVTGGIVAAGTLLVINFAVSRLATGSRRVGQWIMGHPTILVYQGHPVMDHLKREHITLDELHAALREHGVPTIDEVGLAVLEVDGSVSVLTNQELPSPSRPHHRFRFLKKHS